MKKPLNGAQIERIDGLSIGLKSCMIPAFGGEQGYWSNYKNLMLDGINAITVTTVLRGEVYDADSFCLDIKCRFDPDLIPESKYGIVYGDPQFEMGIDAYVRRALDVPSALGADLMSYTEAGMQENENISMEGSRTLILHLASLSNHALLKMTGNTLVDHIKIAGFSWNSIP